MGDPLDDENALVKLTSLGVLGVGLAGMFLGYEWFWLAFVIGFAVLVPAVKVVSSEFGLAGGTAANAAGDRRRVRTERRAADRAGAPDSKQDALDALRERYARGELSESEFEHKVERLLETETLADARDSVTRESPDGDPDSVDRNREADERAR